MKDIVDRLLLDAEPTESDMEEAAAEITRLRAENIHLRRAGMGRPSAELHEAAMAELREEITRLCAENSKLKSTDMAVALADMSLRDEITRLRVRVEVLRKELTDIAEYCDELDPTVSTISYAARRALARTAEEAKP